MSRSNYSEGWDLDQWDLIRWRGAVVSAIKGTRGQKLLREMAAALDAMPVKELIAEQLKCEDGVCAMGAVAQARGMDVSAIDPEDPDAVAEAFSIAPALAREISYVNDEWGYKPTPADRWKTVRKWVAEQIAQ